MSRVAAVCSGVFVCRDVLEGTYYPAISLFTEHSQKEGASATFNFGASFSASSSTILPHGRNSAKLLCPQAVSHCYSPFAGPNFAHEAPEVPGCPEARPAADMAGPRPGDSDSSDSPTENTVPGAFTQPDPKMTVRRCMHLKSNLTWQAVTAVGRVATAADLPATAPCTVLAAEGAITEVPQDIAAQTDRGTNGAAAPSAGTATTLASIPESSQLDAP